MGGTQTCSLMNSVYATKTTKERETGMTCVLMLYNGYDMVDFGRVRRVPWSRQSKFVQRHRTNAWNQMGSISEDNECCPNA